MNYRFGKGDETGQHSHTIDGHTTFCFAGSLRLERWVNGVDKEKEVLDIPAGGFAFIAKDVIHNVIAMEDDSAYACVWAVRVDTEGKEIPGQLDGINAIEVDAWETLENAPWLRHTS